MTTRLLNPSLSREEIYALAKRVWEEMGRKGKGEFSLQNITKYIAAARAQSTMISLAMPKHHHGLIGIHAALTKHAEHKKLGLTVDMTVMVADNDAAVATGVSQRDVKESLNAKAKELRQHYRRFDASQTKATGCDSQLT